MKKLKNKGYTFFKSPETFFLVLMASTIPFKLNIGNVTIILSGLFALFLLLKRVIPLKNFKGFDFIIPLLLFAIAAISALKSKDIYEGISQLEKLLLMVVIPLILCVFKGRTVNLYKVFYAYSFGVTLAIGILLINNIIKTISGATVEQLFFFNFTALYDQHPVYFSTYILLSLFFLFHFVLLYKQRPLRYLWLAIILVIHCLGLIFCASKAVIVCCIVLAAAYVLYNRKINQKIRVISMGTIFLIAIAIFSVPQIKERFLTGLEYGSMQFEPTNDLLKAKQFTYDEKTNISDIELRTLFVKIGMFHLTDDQKVWFGYGLGDVQHYLDYYYMTYNLAPNWYEGFNLHNQYLQYLVTYGVFALILFLIYLILSLIHAIKEQNVLHFVFIAMILFVFIFESYLSRNKGIVLLFFFNTLFLTQKFNFEDRNPRHSRHSKLSRRF